MSSWITVPFQIDTPMFLGGAGQACDPGAQFVPSLRGALRFWFRALVGPAYGENTTGLANAEAMVFGWAAEDGKPWGSSPIRFRLESHAALIAVPKRPEDIKQITDDTPKVFPEWALHKNRLSRDFFGVTYLLGPGLWHRKCGLMRGFLQPGDGSILVSCPEDLREVLGCCLWALSRYGGLGSRNRKGFGSLSFHDLPSALNRAASPSPQTWADVARDAQDRVAKLVGSDRPALPLVVSTLPSYPRLDTTAMLVPRTDPEAEPMINTIVEAFDTQDSWPGWQQAMGEMGQRWRRLRTVENTNNRQYAPLVETPEWREVFVDDETDEFAVGALGLPLIYGHAAPRIQVNLAASNGDEMRLPSPIRFRIHRCPDGKYKASVLSLACVSVPDGTTLLATQQGHQTRTLELSESLTLWRISSAMKALNEPAVWTNYEWPG